MHIFAHAFYPRSPFKMKGFERVKGQPEDANKAPAVQARWTLTD